MMIKRLMLLTILGLTLCQVQAQQHVFRTIRLADEIWQTDLYKQLGVVNITATSKQITREGDKAGIVQAFKVNNFGLMTSDSSAGKNGWTHRLYYDDKGKLSDEYYANPYDTTETSFLYDRNVLVHKEIVSKAGEKKEVLHTFRYEYNNYGKLTQFLKSSGTDALDTLLLVTYSYDEQQRISERSTKNFEKGYLIQSDEIFNYDDLNHYIMIESKMLTEKATTKALAYDETGRLLEYINVRRKLRIVLKYDERGLLVQKRYYSMPKNLLVGEKDYAYSYR